MFLFGHTGIAFAAAQKLNPLSRLSLVALIALMPDFIDKSIHYLIWPQFTKGNTRTVAHSLLFTLIFSLLIFLWQRYRPSPQRKWLWLIPWIHIFLDEMWEPVMRVSLLWPFLGHDFPPFDHKGLKDHLWRVLSKPEVIIGEVLGILFLLQNYLKIRSGAH